MTKSRGYALLFAFTGYIAASHLATAVILLGGLAAVQSGFALARLALGFDRIYWLKPVLCDASGFAVVSALTALTQYYFLSLLGLSRAGRAPLLAAMGCSALLSGVFFWGAAEYSSLGAYGLSGLPVTLSALIGGTAAVFQKPEENPWPAAYARFFSHF
ncbi:MAG TPA: hypothetical protein PKI19_12605 [Elusimicrobiales bacterium]|nr:hypothetical protein [Elusimicrobiales bacterium]